MLSKKSLEILQMLFSPESNLQIPVGIVEQILEIRQWLQEELNKKNVPAS